MATRWLAGVLTIAVVGVPAGIAEAGTTERVSVDSAEGQADVFAAPGGVTAGSFGASISSDGRFVAFESNATDLVAGDTNGATDVFVRDRQAGTTERVSIDSAEVQGNALSGGADVSGNGRFVAFESEATNLVAGDTNGVGDVFVRDRLAGTTERVSLDAGDGQLAGPSIEASISDDGRFVVFRVVTPSSQDPVLVRDRRLGTTEVASVAPPGFVLGGAFSPSMSGDGRFVAFPAFTGTDLESVLVLRDRVAGTSEALGLNRGPAALSGDGSVIAFTTGLGLDTVVEVLDRRAGTTERIGPGFDVALSANGRFVAFMELAVGQGPQDVVIHDRVTGADELASVDSAGRPGDQGGGPADLSASGRYVAFTSSSTNLVPGDTNGAYDIFVRDRAPSPRDQLLALRDRIARFGPSFTSKLDAAVAALDRGDLAGACGSLRALANHARAQAGKKLTRLQAVLLVLDAERIRLALGCERG